MFDRPKPTVGYRANGRRIIVIVIVMHAVVLSENLKTRRAL